MSFNSTSERPNEPIAIVGMGCRFPGGANEPSKLWDLLASPHDVAREIPANRFNLARFYHKDGSHHGTTNTRMSYFLDEDVTKFDTKFFSIPPGEAEVIDPQQRLLLEVVYESLESAGIPIHRLSNSDTSVYVGVMCQDYFALQAQDVNSVPTYAATGIAASNASSRISYFFNWHGPSMTIDTACSSSMVGVNEAVQALRNGTSRTAVACGTNLLLSAFSYITESKLGMLSPTGRSRMWDADADGYARGEGVACVVLKTLTSAIADGDNIECIIREVGVNHDGKTKGLTMPSAAAQASLIRSVYTRAGLDPTKKSDRCQYFEAHGTGTPAGDPQEAEALCRAFFPEHLGADSLGESHDTDDQDVLFVGSIKTVIGHTEGTAGLAGLIKTCLALQAGTIPPNLLFNKLNPALEPFTRNLRITCEKQDWPVVVPGQPRRASVNSFGFGGTNAHVILEAYTPPPLPSPVARLTTNVSSSSSSSTNGSSTESLVSPTCAIPIVVSAASEKSLVAAVKNILAYLERDQQHDESQRVTLQDLAWTLSSKRSALAQRLTVSASSLEQLRKKFRAKFAAPAPAPDGGAGAEKDNAVTIPIEDLQPAGQMGTASLSVSPSILGVFTGQGTQWPTMGMELIRSIPLARDILAMLDASLASLPTPHRPTWTLAEQLAADKSTSRLNEAAFSQPLCTAVQIILVELLQLAGIRFRAVVGHSSGEIAAAYAAGFLSSTDAIRIAYYRGYYAKLAAGAAGQKGAMVAVGTSIEDATDLCQIDDFENSLFMACHNSPTSVTLSGDHESVQQALTILEEEGKFARALRVDTAYHSSHMMRCAAAYLAALRKCRIQPLEPDGEDAPLWFSSVHEDSRVLRHESGGSADGLDGPYWVKNMTNPVLFRSAVKAAVSQEGLTLNLATEVGPHAALQGPAVETILEATGKDVPYTGTLKRGSHDVEAFADALGFVWSHFGPNVVDLANFQQGTVKSPAGARPQAVQDLPLYPWDRERSLWAESRSSKLFRLQEGKFHDLLGILTADGTTGEWRWKNVLKIKEIKWLSGHALQGQTVFPGTGYIAMAMEAGLELAKGQLVSSIDLLDLEIKKAISLDEAFGTELVVSMINVREEGPNLITAGYSVFSTISKESSQLALNCTGQVRVTLGEGSETQFAPRDPPVAELAPVDVDRFYQVLKDDLGYGYEDSFRSLLKIQRRLGYSTATIQNTAFEEDETPLLFHPGMLDSALQGLNAACSAPGDGRLWSIVAPTYFRRITLIPSLCGINMTDLVNIDCTVTDPSDNRITGDIDVYSAEYSKRIMEIEGVRFSPFSMPTRKDDRHLFQEPFFCLDEPDAELVFGNRTSSDEERKKGVDAERAAFFYLKNLHLSVTHEQRKSLPWFRQALINNAERLYNSVKAGDNSHAPDSWIKDTHSDIVSMMDSYGDDADFNLTRAVGEHLLLPQVLNGDNSILEYMTKNNYLDRYYIDAIGFEMLNFLVAGVLGQLSTKYSHMNMLEIGAGTGGATQAIFGAIGPAFRSYTYTDVSSGFFEKAAEKFQAQSSKMIFKVLDIETDPATQGFAPRSYDIIVASNVLHATKSMKKTLENTRKLLKPGGYLVLLEVIRSDVMRHGLVMGGLPGWWIGFDEGRTTGPSLTLSEWDQVLRQTGFSGIETSSPMPDAITVPGSVFVSRAMNDQVSLLATPLTTTSTDASHGPLMVIGGSEDATKGIAAELGSILESYFSPVIRISNLDDLPDEIPDEASVVCLQELDTSLFESMDGKRWETFKKLLSSTGSMLWLLRRSQDDNPHAATTLGLFRTLFYELPGSLLQTVDLKDGVSVADVQASALAELILRLKLLTQMLRAGESESLLWGFEPELVLHPDGRLYVPRVRQSEAQNARYNSSKRAIKTSLDINSTVLELVKLDGGAGGGGSYALREKHLMSKRRPAARWNAVESAYDDYDSAEESDSEEGDVVTIRVSCSLISSLKTPAGYYFIQIGTDTSSGHKLLFFSSSNTSVVTVPRSFTTRVDEGRPDQEIVDGQYMSFVVAELMTQQILGILPPSGTVIAYEPDPVVSSLLSKQLSNLGRKAIFITSKPNIRMRNWIYLHENSTKRVIDAAISGRDVTLYIDASNSLGSANGQGLGSRIAASVPELCDKVSLASLAASTASRLPTTAPKSITKLLRKVASFAASQLNSVPDGAPLDILPLKQVAASPPRSQYTLVYWQLDRKLPVSIEPILKREDLFRPDRTYWLAGLGGDIGRSLADFMVAHGAQHIVISSRTPLVDEKWVEWHRENGVNIVYHACDLTSFESTQQVHEELVKTMPPIDGVANGAMVLRDSSVVSMSFEALDTVLRSKIQSTSNLNRLFSSRVLDWFIGFSSIVGITGNPGQAAYSAGNLFMKTVVKDRRARGLAGSTIDICRVIGMGYIERESSGRLTREHQARLMTRSGTLTMGEVDLHALFAEAIIHGRPDSGLNPEIITGLAPISVEKAKDAFWALNPKFGLIIEEQGTTAGQGSGGKGNSVPVRQLLEAAKTMQDVSKILLSVFKAKLQALMFLSDSESLSEVTPLVDMGVDSLVGVELRSWFLKELGVDVPVMKILGGASISELVEGIMEKLPAEITSRLDGGGGGDAKAAATGSTATVAQSVKAKAPLPKARKVKNDAEVRVVEIFDDEDLSTVSQRPKGVLYTPTQPLPRGRAITAM